MIATSAGASPLARYGSWLARYARTVRAVQWLVVAVYAFLVVVPALLPLPADDARALNNVTLVAQWAFWGLWWPFVVLSMFAVGRTWCGVFCPSITTSRIAWVAKCNNRYFPASAFTSSSVASFPMSTLLRARP